MGPDEFKSYISKAKKGKYFPGYAEVAYNLLRCGGSISAVKSRLGATQRTFDRWVEENEDFRNAIELGIEAGVAGLQGIGYQNVTAKFFQHRVWSDLISMVPKTARQVEERDAVKSKQIQVEFCQLPADDEVEDDD